MTTPAYPTDLPYAFDQWSLTPFREPLRTDMDGGNQRARRRAGDNVPTASFSVQMSGAEYGTFQAFLIDDLANGTLEFTMQVWNGSAFESKTVKFKETPVPQAVAYDRYSVPFKVDVLS